VAVTAAFAGFVVMMLEILGTRLMAPVLGTGLYVWTAQITAAMLGLAAGYALGGRAAARSDLAGLRRALVTAITVVATWLLVLPFLTPSLLTNATALDLRGAAMVGSSVLLGPPMVALGAVTPLSVALWSSGAPGPDTAVGRVLAISTFGSLAGALGTAFVLLPIAPTSTILGVTSALAWALAAALAALGGMLPVAFLRLFGIVLAATSSGATGRTPPAGLEHRALGHGVEIKVVDLGNVRYLLVDGSGQTAIDRRTGACAYDYAEGVAHLKAARPNARSALLIGLGGGCIIRQLAPISVDAVEIDPAMAQVAEEYFQVPRSSYRLHLSDGRAFLARSPRRWPLVILDAFAADVPVCHLFTREAFETMRRRLEPGGVAMVNTLVSDGPHGQRFHDRLVETLRQSFRTVQVQEGAMGAFGYGNLLLFASDGPLPDGMTVAPSLPTHAHPFVDDFNDCDIEYGLETGIRTRRDDWASWGLATLVYE
jgi:spermidine synthase